MHSAMAKEGEESFISPRDGKLLFLHTFRTQIKKNKTNKETNKTHAVTEWEVAE